MFSFVLSSLVASSSLNQPHKEAGGLVPGQFAVSIIDDDNKVVRFLPIPKEATSQIKGMLDNGIQDVAVVRDWIMGSFVWPGDSLVNLATAVAAMAAIVQLLIGASQLNEKDFTDQAEAFVASLRAVK